MWEARGDSSIEMNESVWRVNVFDKAILKFRVNVQFKILKEANTEQIIISKKKNLYYNRKEKLCFWGSVLLAKMCLNEKSFIWMDDSIHTLNILDFKWLEFIFVDFILCIIDFAFPSIIFFSAMNELFLCSYIFFFVHSSAGALYSLFQTVSLVNSLQTV